MYMLSVLSLAANIINIGSSLFWGFILAFFTPNRYAIYVHYNKISASLKLSLLNFSIEGVLGATASCFVIRVWVRQTEPDRRCKKEGLI